MRCRERVRRQSRRVRLTGSHLLLAALALLQVSPGVAVAQELTWEGGRVHLTRPELEEMLSTYEQAAASGSDEQVRERARAEAELIRARLRDGDLQAGDRVFVAVRGYTELSDTFTVTPSRTVAIPTLGEVPVGGVLRSELEAHVAEHVARFIVEPKVTTRTFVRVAILGEVNNPGFYTAPAEALITDLIMLAGGPTRTAKLEAVEITRGQEKIWSGAQLQEAMTAGRTIDQLSLRAGDQITVPGHKSSRFMSILRTGLYVIPSVAFLISRIF